VYFITAWDRGSTFGAQTNVVVWKSGTGWSLVTTPFLRGFVEDKELTGRYDLVDTFPEEKHYQFEQGRFIQVGK